MYCKNCGKKVSENSQFCKFCGVKFNNKEIRNGKTIVSEIDKRKVINKNSIISLTFAIVSTLCCFISLSLGIIVVVAVMLSSLAALFFRLKAKDEMYKLYDSKGKLVGKKMITASLVLSLVSLISAIGSLPRFI